MQSFGRFILRLARCGVVLRVAWMERHDFRAKRTACVSLANGSVIDFLISGVLSLIKSAQFDLTFCGFMTLDSKRVVRSGQSRSFATTYAQHDAELPIATECYGWLIQQGFPGILCNPSQSVGFTGRHKIGHIKYSIPRLAAHATIFVLSSKES